MGHGMGEMIVWAPGVGEIIILLILLVMVPAVFAGIFLLVKNLAGIGGKTCPFCAENIKKAAKVCRHCQRDVTVV